MQAAPNCSKSNSLCGIQCTDFYLRSRPFPSFAGIRKNRRPGRNLGAAMLFLSGTAVLVALVHGGIPPNRYEMPVLALFAEESIVFHAVLLTTMFLSAISGLTSTCVFFTGLLPERKMGILLALPQFLRLILHLESLWMCCILYSASQEYF